MRAAISTVLVAVTTVVACASELPRMPASLEANDTTGSLPSHITITSPVTVVPPSQYRREIRAGSQWQRVGRLSQGAVYKPVDTVFTLESAQVHEAYLVIDGRTLVGAYLPVEKAFVKVEPVKDLPFTSN